jgi:hypothetical protein
LESLENEFVGLGEGSSIQQFLALEANRLNRRLKIRVRLPTFDDVCRMVEMRVGFAVVPESVFLRCQRMIEVRKLDLTDNWAIRELKICMRSFENLPPAGKRLVEHLNRLSPSLNQRVQSFSRFIFPQVSCGPYKSITAWWRATAHIGRKLIEIVEERLHVSVIIRPEGAINRFPFRRPCDQGIEQHFTNGFIEVLAYHDQRRASVVVSANDLRSLSFRTTSTLGRFVLPVNFEVAIAKPR